MSVSRRLTPRGGGTYLYLQYMHNETTVSIPPYCTQTLHDLYLLTVDTRARESPDGTRRRATALGHTLSESVSLRRLGRARQVLWKVRTPVF